MLLWLTEGTVTDFNSSFFNNKICLPRMSKVLSTEQQKHYLSSPKCFSNAFLVSTLATLAKAKFLKSGNFVKAAFWKWKYCENVLTTMWLIMTHLQWSYFGIMYLSHVVICQWVSRLVANLEPGVEF